MFRMAFQQSQTFFLWQIRSNFTFISLKFAAGPIKKYILLPRINMIGSLIQLGETHFFI